MGFMPLARIHAEIVSSMPARCGLFRPPFIINPKKDTPWLLQITEFTEGGASFTQSATLAVLPSTTTQSVAVSGTSTQSATLSDTTRLVRIVADEELPHRLGENPRPPRHPCRSRRE